MSDRAEYSREWRKANPGKSYGYWKRSRLANPTTRDRQRQRNYELGAVHLTIPERMAKRPWTEAEDAIVSAHTVTDREIAVKIRRSVIAVQVRRHKLRRAT